MAGKVRPQKNNAQEDETQKEAQRILERVNRDSEGVGTSSMARGAKSFGTILSGIDGTSEDNDPIEVLGKRIGRALGMIAVVILLIYLTITYVLN